MRVISGFLRGRKIIGYDIDGTRATMDRVKESLFAILQEEIRQSVFLDLFAGTGSIGIEAISNGAKKCYFVDNNKRAVDVINKNINNLDIGSYSCVINNDWSSALEYFAKANLVFDIVYIDPPYKYRCLEEILSSLIVNNLINKNSLVVLEYSEFSLDDIKNYEVIRSKKYSNKMVSILRLKD